MHLKGYWSSGAMLFPERIDDILWGPIPRLITLERPTRIHSCSYDHFFLRSFNALATEPITGLVLEMLSMGRVARISPAEAIKGSGQ